MTQNGEPIALVAATAAGRIHAQVVASAWPQARLVDAGSAAESLRQAWRAGESIVAFLAAGAVVRIIAPLLTDKATDPAVVVVDDAARHAVALLGGHAAGANTLARRVAALLDARPVVTTATDARDLPGLDTLGMPVEGGVSGVTRAILDGEPVRLQAQSTWPLPALPDNVGADLPGSYRLLVTDRLVPFDERTAVLRPPSLVVGVGASRGVAVEELQQLLERVLAEAQLSATSIGCLATVDVKADEAGILELARRLGVPLLTYPAEQLATVPVPNPSEVVRTVVGTGSVAEAAALIRPVCLPGHLQAGPPQAGGSATGELLVAKTASAMATVAVARHAPRGRLAIVGLGPGARDLVTPRAVEELRRASVVVGLDQYVDQIRDLLRPGTTVVASGLGAEEARARAAVELASSGKAVALIGSGDAGVYAMASPALEYAGTDIDVVGVPGVTAGLAAASLLGAPLGHDHVYLSLSDLHTPWEVISGRVAAAAAADLVVLFYNPRSRTRDWQLAAAMAELAVHRPADTPVGVVRHASRPEQSVQLHTVAGFDPADVDMYSLVVVGNSRTKVVAGRMVTPRGYRWLS
ncbi:precorrin-3B C(17)-methyltransferase [Kineosporia sp. R_H_3]|uniref:precorrin-3B C(17)-methyltransferase n=1 Tax=Kineosporia sp. R_H_3 TaxID=1961848 RepID=UPI000B4A7AF4|nr:precorrin-3B C(17)-methyltransferase [Kineosporia sp. R_H_3]